MEAGHLVNIIRIYLLFFILVTGILSLVINERKKRLLARKQHFEAALRNMGIEAPLRSTRKLRSPEINTIAAIAALKGGGRLLALLLAVLSFLLVLTECYFIMRR